MPAGCACVAMDRERSRNLEANRATGPCSKPCMEVVSNKLAGTSGTGCRPHRTRRPSSLRYPTTSMKARFGQFEFDDESGELRHGTTARPPSAATGEALGLPSSRGPEN